MCMEAKLTCLKQASFFNALLDYFQNDVLNSLPVVDKRLIVRKFVRNFGSLPGFSNVLNIKARQDKL
jgi:hypothetical protein